MCWKLTMCPALCKCLLCIKLIYSWEIGNNSYYPHFTEEEIDTAGDEATCPRDPELLRGRPGPEHCTLPPRAAPS